MSVFIYAQFPSADFAENAASMIHQRVTPVYALHIGPQKQPQQEEVHSVPIPLIPVNNLANGYIATPGLTPGIFAMSTELLSLSYDESGRPVSSEEGQQSPGDGKTRISVCCEERDRYLVESICVAMGGSLEHSR